MPARSARGGRLNEAEALPAAEPAGAELELVLAPDDLKLLARTPGLVRQGPARQVAVIWYDNPDSDLAGQDLILAREGREWRMERLRPGQELDWPAALPAPVLAADASPASLHPTPPFDVAPVAAFQGRRRRYRAQAVELLVQYGSLRGVVAERPVCRLLLAGPAAEVSGLAQRLAATMRVGVPRATLALEGLAVAKGIALPPRRPRPPHLPPDLSVSDGLARLIAHLLDAMLHWFDHCAEASPEPVHQARVASRRLRSALSLYKHETACPELDALAPALKDCAARLGAARDWDVFLDGTGARLTERLPDDRRVSALLRAARRRRAAVYAELHAFLASPDFRQLEIALACAASFRPWERTVDPAGLHRPTASFAAEALKRRMKRVQKAGQGLEDLPIAALHELRKDCKRLRYAAEFFAAGFPGRSTKAFLKRLAALQEDLGALNDSAATTGLLAQLGPIGRGFAGGLVEGLAAASGGSARERIGKAWKRFRAAPLFWTA